MPEISLKPYTNPAYIQAVNNPDEARINRFGLLLRELFFGIIIGHLPESLVRFLCDLDLFPVGVVIDFVKQEKE